jgi:hypothetical protein
MRAIRRHAVGLVLTILLAPAALLFVYVVLYFTVINPHRPHTVPLKNFTPTPFTPTPFTFSTP